MSPVQAGGHPAAATQAGRVAPIPSAPILAAACQFLQQQHVPVVLQLHPSLRKDCTGQKGFTGVDHIRKRL